MTLKKQQLAAIVGDGNVIDDASVLDAYSKDESFATPLKPWFVVRPAEATEVQALVKWANETGTPLVPVSSGAPHFHGDTVPSAAEAVIVDLSRMKKILKVDRRNRVALIEPGVTYAELIPALAEHGMRLPQPLMPRGNKSVIACLLDREPTTIPRLNFSLIEPLRNCGVVWGTGEMAFTGEAGNGPLSIDEQWSRGFRMVSPVGPASTDLVRLVAGAQGTMGIVVWASIKLELIPEVQHYHVIPAPNFAALTDFVYRATRNRLGDEFLILNRTRLASLVESDPAARAALRDSLPEWALLITVAGAAYLSEERVAVQEGELATMAQSFSLKVLSGLPGVSRADLARIAGGVADKAPAEAQQDIFFLTTLDKVAGYVASVEEVAVANSYPTAEIGIYVQPQHQGNAHHVSFALPYDPADKRAVARVRKVHEAASARLVEEAAYFSRPYGQWADLMYGKDPNSVELLRVIKGILDPANIMNPGKLCF